MVSLGVLAIVPSAQAVSISPAKFELSTNPGDVVQNVIRIYNDSAEPVNVTVNVDNFSPTGEAGQVVIDEISPDTGYSLKSWVTLNESAFSLEPRGSKAIEFTINVPAHAEPGGHYGSILASIAPFSAGGGVGVVQRIGALLLLDVSGQVVEKMYVAEFSAPSFSEYGPVDLIVRFKNDGSIHLKPRGFIKITNMLGKDVGQVDIPQSNVLPQSARKFSIPWGHKYLFGKYTATLSAIYGSENNSLTAVIEFWVIPWKIAGIILLILALIITLIFRGRRRISLALRVLRKGDLAQ